VLSLGCKTKRAGRSGGSLNRGPSIRKQDGSPSRAIVAIGRDRRLAIGNGDFVGEPDQGLRISLAGCGLLDPPRNPACVQRFQNAFADAEMPSHRGLRFGGGQSGDNGSVGEETCRAIAVAASHTPFLERTRGC